MSPKKASLLILVFVFCTFLTATRSSADTYTVTSTSCTGPGSITEAMALANANSGEDTITFNPAGLQIQAGTCPEPPFGFNYFILHATESVIIEGNDAKVAGLIRWVSSGGIVNPLDKCPAAEDVVASLTPGFIKVGLRDQDNSAITVTVRNLDLQELNSVARIEQNASLILEDLEVNTIIPAAGNCDNPAVEAQDGANFTARRTQWSYIIALREVFFEIPFAYVNAAFVGGGAVGGGETSLLRIRFSGSKTMVAPFTGMGSRGVRSMSSHLASMILKVSLSSGQLRPISSILSGQTRA